MEYEKKIKDKSRATESFCKKIFTHNANNNIIHKNPKNIPKLNNNSVIIS
jgi:hypothetical protein